MFSFSEAACYRIMHLCEKKTDSRREETSPPPPELHLWKAHILLLKFHLNSEFSYAFTVRRCWSRLK